jgi:hypothetical protein
LTADIARVLICIGFVWFIVALALIVGLCRAAKGKGEYDD